MKKYIQKSKGKNYVKILKEKEKNVKNMFLNARETAHVLTADIGGKTVQCQS